jgi:hypothetical protein
MVIHHEVSRIRDYRIRDYRIRDYRIRGVVISALRCDKCLTWVETCSSLLGVSIWRLQ